MLAREGVSVYVDWADSELPEKPGRETANKIKRVIKTSDLFLLLATDNALNSKWVPWELGVADEAKGTARVLLAVTEDASSKGSEYTEIYRRVEKLSYPPYIRVLGPKETTGQVSEVLPLYSVCRSFLGHGRDQRQVVRTGLRQAGAPRHGGRLRRGGPVPSRRLRRLEGAPPPLADQIDLKVEREHDLVALAEYYVNARGGRSKLTQTIIEEFNRGAQVTPAHGSSPPCPSSRTGPPTTTT